MISSRGVPARFGACKKMNGGHFFGNFILEGRNTKENKRNKVKKYIPTL